MARASEKAYTPYGEPAENARRVAPATGEKLPL